MIGITLILGSMPVHVICIQLTLLGLWVRRDSPLIEIYPLNAGVIMHSFRLYIKYAIKQRRKD